ncbi:MAG TPA: hypothetical protein VFT19_08530 [Solirubrobacterales bacterium]|nr:hypothetical protein [Solirubrobacterales bacterium]
MWRARSRREERRLVDLSEEEARRRVLDLVLGWHPEPLSYAALATGVSADPGDVADALTLAQAVRDLALAGLLCSDGVRVAPTRAALAFARLEAGR